jgi:hypothetical protein
MQKDLEEALYKLEKLSIDEKEFVIKYINEAHRQANNNKNSTVESAIRPKKACFKPEERVGFFTSFDRTPVSDSKRVILHKGDRVRFETNGEVNKTKILVGDLGWVVGYEPTSGFVICIADKLIGKHKEITKRQPQNLTIISE